MKARFSHLKRHFFRAALALAILAGNSISVAQEPAWIWSPKQSIVPGKDSQGECFFRKKFTLIKPEQAELIYAAGDEFEIFVNGKLAARGQSFGTSNKIDLKPYVVPGVNLIAARVRHYEGQQVGLSMKFRCKEKGESRWRGLSTDASWKTRLQEVESWKSTTYNDLGWLKAQVLEGQVAEVTSKEPAESTQSAIQQVKSSSSMTPESNPAEATQDRSNEELIEFAETPMSDSDKALNARLEVNPEFTVEQVLTPDETGSLIAMEFNEFGNLLLSREGGPLLIADPTKPMDDPERVRVYCDQVNTCQGILALNGSVYVTGNGPQGLGLYRLADTDRDGTVEVQTKLMSFTGKLGEHGPHGIQLGPDGMLYVIVGNDSQANTTFAETSPYQHFYEGDLIPRYEDPGGHAVGVKAPGGTVVRCTLDGTKVERVCGGIRNAYDLVFDHRGELFIHDSDMEADAGMTWYRPTYVFHAQPGAELGWRSGWSKFPQHFVDQTPAVADTGRGSPTGAVLYQHLQFPLRYQDSIFLADWSEGRILVLRTEQTGGGFTAKTETFLKGRPLNVVDLAVGEDGALYFCTGGRGTEGGVYRVSWKGSIPERMLDYKSDLAKVVRHPQPGSAWARQNIANLKIAMGNNWGSSIEGVAKEVRNTVKMRIRAMQLMVLYGPSPSNALLQELAEDPEAEIRMQVAKLCGLTKPRVSRDVLESLLADSNPMVRRLACESFLRLGIQPELNSLKPMLSSIDRAESLAARRLLEQIPTDEWEDEVLTTDNKRLFIQGSVALMTAEPTLKRAYQILAQSSKFMEGFVNDFDFVDMLRTMELALVRGQVEPGKVPGLTIRIGNEFPSANSIINQELVRLMAYLKAGDLDGRIAEYLNDAAVPTIDKVHFGMHMQSLGNALSSDARLAVINALELARVEPGMGGSYRYYIQRAIEDLSPSLTASELVTVLENGHRWPVSVITAFQKLPQRIDSQTVQTVIRLDEKLRQADESPEGNQARLGIIAILARNGDVESMNYLRYLWGEEESRRSDIVIGLSQQPGGENWAYLVSSLNVLDDLTAGEVLVKLTEVRRRPREARFFSEVLSIGYRLRGNGAEQAANLLQHWTGQQVGAQEKNWQGKLNAWTQWYKDTFPDGPVVNTAYNTTKRVGRYSVDQLLTSLESKGFGNPIKGHEVFKKADCAKCHQFNGTGMGAGPDLSTLAFRYSIREAIEATLDPSSVIPDRYASKSILTIDGDIVAGMTVKQADGSYFVLQSDGSRIRVKADDIEEIKESKVSAMPEGLLNGLTEYEIRDLFAYLMQPAATTAGKESNGPRVGQVPAKVR